LLANKIQVRNTIAYQPSYTPGNGLHEFMTWQVLPPGMHLEKAIAVARKELKWECDYIREANNQVPLVGQILRDRSPGAAAL
jgi:hypothetical protein